MSDPVSKTMADMEKRRHIANLSDADFVDWQGSVVKSMDHIMLSAWLTTAEQEQEED